MNHPHPQWTVGDTARVVAPGPAATTNAPQLVRILKISGDSVIVEAIEGRYAGSRWATGTYKLTAVQEPAKEEGEVDFDKLFRAPVFHNAFPNGIWDTPAPAPLPKRARATRIQDEADRHHGVNPDEARKIAAHLGTAGFNALQSADEDGYLTAGYPASLAALARKELVEQAEHPAAGGGPRTYRITPLGRTVARLKAAALTTNP